MSLFQAAINRAKYKAETLPVTSAHLPMPWFIEWLGGKKTASGQKVTPDNAISLSTVFMAKTLISESMAQLPFAPYIEETSKSEKSRINKRIFKEHFTYQLIKRPHPLISSYTFRKVMFSWACIYDNAYAIIVRNGKGQAEQLFPIHPERVIPEINNGRFVYHIDGKEILDPMSVFHIIGNTDDGLVGKSRINIGKEGLGKALAVEKFGAEFFSKGINVDGFIQHPGKLKDEAAVERLKKSFAQANVNNHGVGLLEEGAEWKPNEHNPQEAQLNETQKVDGLKAAQLLNIPVTMLNYLERGTYNNVEQLSIQYVKHTLMPWAKNWQEECWYKLLMPREKKEDNIYFKFNFKGLLEGDMQSRANFYEIMSKVGAYSPNHILEKEDENGYDGGDVHIISPGAQTIENFQDQTNEMKVNGVH